MPTPRVTIDELPEQGTPEDTNYIVVQDEGVSKKMSLATLKQLSSDQLVAHMADPLDAHDASAISATVSGSGVDSTTVQGQLGQLATKADASVVVADAALASINDHIADAADAHDASAISALADTFLSGTTVQEQLTSIKTQIDAGAAAGPPGADGAAGPAGAAGATGPAGAPGVDGVGVPAGGIGGQILAKNSDTSYDTLWIPAPSGGGTGITDANKGDITVSSSGSNWQINAAAVAANELASDAVTTAKIANTAVTNAKLADMTAPVLHGRVTAGAGSPENLTPAQARAVIASGSGGGTTNFLAADGSWATPAAVIPDANKGDITVSSSGANWQINADTISTIELADSSVANANLAANAVTDAKVSSSAAIALSKLASGAATSFLGNPNLSASPPEVMTPAQARTVIATGSGGGTTNFLAADGSWTQPASAANRLSLLAYVATLTEPPSTGQVRFNNATQTAVTRVWVSETTSDGYDIAVSLARALPGHHLYMQSATNAALWVRYSVVSGTDDGVYWDYTVTYHSGPGGITAGNVLFSTIIPATILPPGGTTGQALTKSSGTDFATTWSSVVANGGGVTAAVALTQAAYNALAPPSATTLYVIIP